MAFHISSALCELTRALYLCSQRKIAPLTIKGCLLAVRHTDRRGGEMVLFQL